MRRQRAAKTSGDCQAWEGRIAEEPFGRIAGAGAADARDVNANLSQAPRVAAKGRGLAFESKQDGNSGYVNCHRSILRLSPRRALTPSAAATS